MDHVAEPLRGRLRRNPGAATLGRPGAREESGRRTLYDRKACEHQIYKYLVFLSRMALLSTYVVEFVFQ